MAKRTCQVSKIWQVFCCLTHQTSAGFIAVHQVGNLRGECTGSVERRKIALIDLHFD